MKRIFIFGLGLLFVLGGCSSAQKSAPQNTSARPLALAVGPDKTQRKIFKQQGKQIRRLVKQYQKASAQEKVAIKEQLSQIISQATDQSMAWAMQRVSAEKENLAQWERKLQERQAHLDEIKARRVDEILSGEAQHRFKLAKKRWKKEIRDLKKSMK